MRTQVELSESDVELLTDFLAQARDMQLNASSAAPAFEIGEGEPGWMRSFVYAHWQVDQEDYAISGPGSAVYRDGPGVVQRFDRDPPDFGWVICALPGREPVAVSEEIWMALQDAGGRPVRLG